MCSDNPRMRSPCSCADCTIWVAELRETWLWKSVSMVTLYGLHHGDRETVCVIVVHRQRYRYQAWVAGNAPVVLHDARRGFVCRRRVLEPPAHTVVRHNDAAWPAQPQRPLEI